MQKWRVCHAENAAIRYAVSAYSPSHTKRSAEPNRPLPLPAPRNAGHLPRRDTGRGLETSQRNAGAQTGATPR